MPVELSESETTAVTAVGVTFSTVSLLGSLVIIASYLRFRELHKTSFALITQLSLADIGADITYFFGDPPADSSACIVQGFLQQWFQLSTIFWTVAIAYMLFKTVLRQQTTKDEFRYSLLLCWGVPLVLACLPFSTDSYGDAGAWCWIKTTDTRAFDAGTAWRFFIFYIPLWIVIVFNLFVYYRVYSGLAPLLSVPNDENTKGMVRVIERLKYYPMILIVCWTFATINRIYDSVHPRSPVFALVILQTMFQTLQGFFNAMVYGLTPSVRNVWRESFAKSNIGFLRVLGNSGHNVQEVEAAVTNGPMHDGDHGNGTMLESQDDEV